MIEELLSRTQGILRLPSPLLLLPLGGQGFAVPDRLPVERKDKQANDGDEERGDNHPGPDRPPPDGSPDLAPASGRTGGDRLAPEITAKILREGAAIRVAQGRILLQRLHADGLQVGIDIAPPLPDRRRIPGDNLFADLQDGLRRVGLPVGQHLVEDNPKRPDVGPGSDPVGGAARLLRRHVVDGSDDGPGHGQIVFARDLRQTEVAEKDPSSRLFDENILGLQIPVDDSLKMGRPRRPRDRLQDCEPIALFQLRHDLGQSPAANVIHGDEVDRLPILLGLSDLMN
ncbi:MAG: hypothetical protein A2Z34_02275 [Planctomycetes bacterium RBG_16_59_8]|nr:MAG: hypothetical protein A2Z34_02275 [Planctomycetes bacterium RBG_16_59_8]